VHKKANPAKKKPTKNLYTIAAMAGIRTSTPSTIDCTSATNKAPRTKQKSVTFSVPAKPKATIATQRLPQPANTHKTSPSPSTPTQQRDPTILSRREKQIAHFSKGAQSPGQAFTGAETSYAKMYPTGGKLAAVKRGRPSKNHSFTSEATFDQVYIHLVISDYLDNSSLANLNACNMLFAHLCKMMSKLKLDYIYDLFDYDRNYAKQEQIPLYRNLQYLFLAIIHRMHVPSMIRSLKGNQTAEYRNPEQILQACEPALSGDLMHDLRDVLYNYNPAKFNGETTAA
jgi:hypothetical protein